ncbi:MAG: hypothetical protein HY877_08435 [Deltaproteobacteria bacterium]|nr:hypothetical protein [Deltaproteobacteria bacterium]
MEYQALILRSAEKNIDNLTPTIRETIFRRVQWLANHAENVIHHPLKGMPDDLRGLCKFRIGDYRVLFVGACVAPSTGKAGGTSPSRSLCSLDTGKTI